MTTVFDVTYAEQSIVANTKGKEIEIAKRFSSRRTKTACMINGAIAPHYKASLIDIMKNGPFSVSTDGSSDTGVEKMNPMTVGIFDVNRGCVTTQFLDMCMSSRSTAEALFNTMDEVLKTHSLTKRKASLQEYCEFCDTSYRTVIKHVNTRWLSLERAVSRTLQQYAALRSYFQSEHDSNPRFQRLKKLFTDPMTEVYLYFYQSSLQIFINFNKFLQREDPIIGLITQQIESFLKKLAGKFVSIQAIQASKPDITNLEYDIAHQLSGNSNYCTMTICSLAWSPKRT
ncbi:uncharacterized protein LOC117111577 [Anneissia japonica]|uniref:uncharacterized protein LOC117111577 n=1 Tax=Anneissia japonica TaxID=1529436 RepID=UPI001425864B|nr:uncharacterized protein LOC117111577 [Anneissia japonica]